VHRVEGDSLLGPDVALGTPASRARVTAQAAAAHRRALAAPENILIDAEREAPTLS
jgi:hypothetical protein